MRSSCYVVPEGIYRNILLNIVRIIKNEMNINKIKIIFIYNKVKA